MPPAQLPLLFTPNVMRIWTSELASAERYLHKAALNLAKDVQNTVKTNPTVGFALLSALVKGKGDFDKVTKTKTVETIMGSLNEEGVRDYIEYLKNIILGEEQNGWVVSCAIAAVLIARADNAGLEERRQWALTQIYGLYKNHKVPKSDAVIASTLDFLLVHGFFIVRKTDKKSAISALHSAPKPALSETTAAATRSKFFSCLVELTTAPITSKDKDGKAHQPGCDASGRLWLRRVIDTLIQVEGDSKHAELVMDADDEIKKLRKEAVSTLAQLDKKSKVDAEVARGVEILLSFSLLQTYDESEDALELLEEVNGAAQRMFKIGSQATEEDEHPPIDTLLDVLIALLEKGSAGLKDLGKLVVGMVGSAFTLSTVEHLVAVSSIHTLRRVTAHLSNSNKLLPKLSKWTRTRMELRSRQRMDRTMPRTMMRMTRARVARRRATTTKMRPIWRLTRSSGGESRKHWPELVSTWTRMPRRAATMTQMRRCGTTSRCSRWMISWPRSSDSAPMLANRPTSSVSVT
jgi:DNA polymerase phi